MDPQPSFQIQQIQSVVPLGIKNGDLFNTLEEIEAKIEEVSKEKYVCFYKRDTRTIETAKERIHRPLNEKLGFYQVKYNCIKGRQGVREILSSRSSQSDEQCLAHIHFTVNQAGDQFEVTSVSNVHNHDVSEEAYRLLSLNKKLDEETQQVAVSLLNLNSVKPIINNGKFLIDKKLHITSKELKLLHSVKIKPSPHWCEQIVNKLIHREDCHLLVDDEDDFQGLFFCNDRMKTTFTAYPEMICIDEIHKFLSNRRTSIYILQIEDGNGEAQVVGVAVLVTRQRPYIQWFLDTFKSICPWESIQLIMAPQSFVQEDDLLRETFPQAEICTHIFEMVRTFQNSKRNPGKFVKDQTATVNFILNLMQADNEFVFERIKQALSKQIPHYCLEYLHDNRDEFKMEWNPLVGKRIKDFLKTSHELLSGLFGIIYKRPGEGGLIDFIDSLFFAVEILEDERGQRVNNFLKKRKINAFLFNEVKRKYQEVLTEFAFLKVLGELNQVGAVASSALAEQTDGIVAFATKTSDVQDRFRTTVSYCNCVFYEAFILPCKHIFHVRNRLEEDLFAEDLCAAKWSLDYYLVSCPISEDSMHKISGIESLNDYKKLLVDNKYKSIVSKCSTLASTAMGAPSEIFPDILTVLDNVSAALTCKNYQLLQNFNLQCRAASMRQRSRSDDSDSTIDNVEIIPEESDYMMNPNLDVANNEEIGTQSSEVDDDVLLLSNQEVKEREINFPRKRGRPRKDGNEKKSRRDDLPFLKRPAKERKSVILSFLLRNTNDAYRNRLLQIEDLLPEERIDNRIAYADLTAIRKYFSDECWARVLKVRKDKEMGDWFCCACRGKFSSTDSSIECTYCLNWSHAGCSTSPDEQGDYFKCSKCQILS